VTTTFRVVEAQSGNASQAVIVTGVEPIVFIMFAAELKVTVPGVNVENGAGAATV